MTWLITRHFVKVATVVLACAVLLPACHRLLESRVAVVNVTQPHPEDCVARAVDPVLGAGATRVNAQGTNYVIAAFPWEGYIRTQPASAGSTRFEIEITRASRYKGATDSLPVVLNRVADAVLRECSP